jgi:formamidopyrimidine-DNA glycosylase
LKRALTDPRLFSGIGNAYSDEILHRARLSPVSLTRSLSAEAIDRLHAATQATLLDWIERLGREAGDWPAKVTAFHPADGGARSLQAAVPRLRCAGAAHRPRRERDELLRALPDRRPAARRPRAVALLKANWPKNIDDVA